MCTSRDGRTLQDSPSLSPLTTNSTSTTSTNKAMFPPLDAWFHPTLPLVVVAVGASSSCCDPVFLVQYAIDTPMGMYPSMTMVGRPSCLLHGSSSSSGTSNGQRQHSKSRGSRGLRAVLGLREFAKTMLAACHPATGDIAIAWRPLPVPASLRAARDAGKGSVIFTTTVERLEETTANIFNQNY